MAAIAQIKTSMLLTHPLMYIDIFQSSENDNLYVIEYNPAELAHHYPFDSKEIVKHIYLTALLSENAEAAVEFRAVTKTVIDRFQEYPQQKIMQ